MTKRIIIFGASGMVGSQLYQNAKAMGYEVIGFAHRNQNELFNTIDLTNSAEIRNAIQTHKPDWIINTAAISNIDFAEQNKELTWNINVNSNKELALICKQLGIRLMYFSSDAIFNGTQGPYAETANLEPVNYYGTTKKDAESTILAILPDAVIIRISVVLGAPKINGASFLDQLDAKLRNGETVVMASDEIRTPIDVTTLANCCMELVSKNFKGIIHLGSTNALSRYDIGLLYAQKFGFNPALIKSQSIPNANKAPRHKRGILDITFAKSLLQTPLISIEESLELLAQTQFTHIVQ